MNNTVLFHCVCHDKRFGGLGCRELQWNFDVTEHRSWAGIGANGSGQIDHAQPISSALQGVGGGRFSRAHPHHRLPARTDSTARYWRKPSNLLRLLPSHVRAEKCRAGGPVSPPRRLGAMSAQQSRESPADPRRPLKGKATSVWGKLTLISDTKRV